MERSEVSGREGFEVVVACCGDEVVVACCGDEVVVACCGDEVVVACCGDEVVDLSWGSEDAEGFFETSLQAAVADSCASAPATISTEVPCGLKFLWSNFFCSNNL